MFQAIRQRLLHLHRCRGLSRTKLRRLLQMDPSLNKIFFLTPSQISEYLLIESKYAHMLYQDMHNYKIMQEAIADNSRYTTITIIDENYPDMLKTIKDAPIVLYTAGDNKLLHKIPSISVIGTRNPSNHAFSKMKHIVLPLVNEKWVIISGMAKGVDSLAHQMALSNGGKTIAILGSGFHHIYPKENEQLFHQITSSGLVITEYPPDVPPRKYHFPERNRIISGLSFATLVIEATERSGTMITVDQALDQGRDVYAVPGSPHMKQAIGCLKLIQDGAKLVISHKDIIKDWENEGVHWSKVQG
ncbi:DNA-processing protein DprA [Ornithinibacillus halotolerans]|uniref:DNA processing protein DprA n=1 Tax=Ornithinibacillus halotolerans TaxID=1274357 RepID=A0A916SBE0_9BACI|nr:DNA-processing protein DprA [Ornithinibacillus halotolerans]GGA92168.1 DNA processing protein DprA [Ornithinibacillus halotolerans]